LFTGQEQSAVAAREFSAELERFRDTAQGMRSRVDVPHEMLGRRKA
jgi:hypothetical protein